MDFIEISTKVEGVDTIMAVLLGICIAKLFLNCFCAVFYSGKMQQKKTRVCIAITLFIVEMTFAVKGYIIMQSEDYEKAAKDKDDFNEVFSTVVLIPLMILACLASITFLFCIFVCYLVKALSAL